MRKWVAQWTGHYGIIGPCLAKDEVIEVVEKAAYDKLFNVLKDIAKYSKPDDRRDPMAYQNNFLGLSVVVKWAKEAVDSEEGFKMNQTCPNEAFCFQPEVCHGRGKCHYEEAETKMSDKPNTDEQIKDLNRRNWPDNAVKAYDDLASAYKRMEQKYLDMRDGHEQVLHKIEAERVEERAKNVKLLDTIKEVIRNSHDIVAKKRCSQTLAEYEKPKYHSKSEMRRLEAQANSSEEKDSE